MKTILLTLALLLPTTALATQEEAQPLNVTEFCTSISKMSAKIMEARQMGADIVDILPLVDNRFHPIVFMAYEVGLVHPEEHKQIVIKEFANHVTVKCYKNFS